MGEMTDVRQPDVFAIYTHIYIYTSCILGWLQKTIRQHVLIYIKASLLICIFFFKTKQHDKYVYWCNSVFIISLILQISMYIHNIPM